MRTRKFWGWGYEDELLTSEEENNIDKRIAKTFGLDSVERIEIPKIEDINLPESSLKSSISLKAITFYLLTTALAISTALFFANFFNPGEGVGLETASTYSAPEAPSLRAVSYTHLTLPTNREV